MAATTAKLNDEKQTNYVGRSKWKIMACDYDILLLCYFVGLFRALFIE